MDSDWNRAAKRRPGCAHVSRFQFVLLAAAAFVSVSALGAPPRSAGMASWYGAFHEGRTMADGCPFRRARLSAASRTLPLGTAIRVRNLRNGLSVVLQVTDRGPYVAGRILDLSQAAARAIGAEHDGLAPVEIEVLPSRIRKSC